MLDGERCGRGVRVGGQAVVEAERPVVLEDAESLLGEEHSGDTYARTRPN